MLGVIVSRAGRWGDVPLESLIGRHHGFPLIDGAAR